MTERTPTEPQHDADLQSLRQRVPVPAPQAGGTPNMSPEAAVESQLDRLQSVIGASSASMETGAPDAPAPQHDFAAAIELVRRMLACGDGTIARRQAAAWLAEWTGAAYVGIAQQMGDQLALVGLIDQLSLPAPVQQAATAVIAESLVRQQALVQSFAPEAVVSISQRVLADRLAAHSGTGRVATAWALPLLNQEGCGDTGVILLWTAETPPVAAALAALQTGAEVLGETLVTLDRAQPSRWEQGLHNLRYRLRRRRGRIASAAVLIVGLLAIYPIPYPVQGTVTLEPKVRRFVAAPFDGRIDRYFVQDGQTVVAGQELGQLDIDALQTQLAACEAEHRQAVSERTGHLAAGQLGEARLAELKANQYAAEKKELEHKIAHAQLTSPIDGVVMSERLEDQQGIPVSTGDTLLQIAPLERLTARIEVPPDEIMRLQPGQPITMQLDVGSVDQRLAVQHIASHGRLNESGKYSFRVEAELDNAAADWKPGMQGTAKIATQRRPAIWCLGKRLWRQLKQWM